MVQNKMAAARKYFVIAEWTRWIAYSKVKINRTFFHKSLVLKRLLVSPGSRSFVARPLWLPLHMLAVITLEPINSCPVALPSPKGFGWDLARPLAHLPRRLARVLLLTRIIRNLILPSPFCFVPWSRVLHKGPKCYCSICKHSVQNEIVSLLGMFNSEYRQIRICIFEYWNNFE